MSRTCRVIQLVFALVFNLVSQNGFVLGCHDAERQALSKFKLSFSDPDNVLSSWTGMACCDWDGVTCNNATAFVNRLDFSGFGQWYLTADKLDPTLIELRHLNHLDLSYTNFLGSQIPGFLGSFKYLRHLDLSNGNFRGYFPPQLNNLTIFELKRLNYLDLSNNDFLGSQIPGFIGFFKNLKFLDLSYANFSVAFPPQLANLTRLQNLSLSGPTGDYLQWAPALMNSQHLEMKDVLSSNTKNIVQLVSRLSSLTYLKLYLCGLTNSPHLYSLLSNSTWSSRIETLDLSSNLLAGSLPNILANMSSLVDLDLSNNFFNGSIPLWVRNFRKSLYLYNNSFTSVEGGLSMVILGAPSRTNLDLSFNLLGGELEGSSTNFSKTVTHDLEILDISDNKISGSLPIWLGEFKKLSRLDIESNNIYGRIPTSIGSLSSLEYLHLTDNSLDGPIPQSIGQLNKLAYLDLSSNHLEGVVSSSHLANLSSLISLNLSNNPLKFTFSNDWIPPFQLIFLDLRSCIIGAQFPRWITSQTYLQHLFLSKAEITGELPPSLCQFSCLDFIDLQSNKLIGTIPDCWKSEYLVYINLASNKLSGPIPESIGLLTGLVILNLNNNLLEGTIPPSVGSLSFLTFLDLGQNMLSGTFPKDFRPKSLRKLKFVRLRSNKLVGLIPEYLCSLPSIQLLDLANNNFTGTIPRCISNLTNMESLSSADIHIPVDEFSDYITTYEEVMEVLKGEEQNYTTILKFVKNLDLSCNGLVGSIPEVITNLSGLIGLNLSHNHLTGSIPESIGKMRVLDSLDLSNNHLSGHIPLSLAALTLLSSLNLSNNQLSGEIPTGNQLQVLNDPSIYAGNPGLCGDPLPNKCKSSYVQQQEKVSEKEEGPEKVLFSFVIFAGFATGFWGIVGSLLLKRWFRFAVFHMVSNLSDFLYVQVMVRINRLRN